MTMRSNSGLLFAASLALVVLALAAAQGLLDRRSQRARPVTARPASSPPMEPELMSLLSGDAGSPLPLRATTPEEVRDVVRFCRSAGTSEIPDLRRAALASEDPLVAGNALRALGRLGAVAHDPQLVALLHDGRLRVRQEVVVALGRSGDPRVVSHLEPLLADGEPELRSLVIQALGRIGGNRARALLRACQDDPAATSVERAFARAALAQGS